MAYIKNGAMTHRIPGTNVMLHYVLVALIASLPAESLILQMILRIQMSPQITIL